MPKLVTRKLLVIDCRIAMCRVIGRAAERHGFAVQLVDAPLQAIDRFLVFQPDLVILDMVMPEIAATEVLTALLDSGVPTRIVLTTSPGIGEAYLALAEGVARFHGVAPQVLFKPFRIAELIEVLDAEVPPAT
jgi:CheY-like chemotaxis protein